MIVFFVVVKITFKSQRVLCNLRTLDELLNQLIYVIFPPRQPRTDFHQYHTDAPLEKSSALHIPANFLLDILFDQLRKGMSGFVCRTTVWEQNADKSIIFALEAAKVMPILPHSMTGMNNHCPPAT